MAIQKNKSNMKMTQGAIPMKSTDGRKYKVRNPTPHDFTESPSLEGVLVARGTLEVNGEDRSFVVIESGSGLAQVFESKALEDLFRQGAVGDHVKLVYQGVKDIGGGQTYKKFSCELWTE